MADASDHTAPSPAPPAHLVDVRWGVAYPLYRVSTGIGRDASNPVLIRDVSASRSHAEVRRDGDRFVLHSVGSAETRVNGEPVAGARPLAEGDVIEIAYTHLRFTRQALAPDVVPAPERTVVDQDLARRNTEIREIVTPAQVRRLRRQLGSPVELHWRAIVMGVLAAALALTALILAARRLF